MSNRDVFCNRTLNMRAIRAIGYDMDYTLVHYHVAQWELRAYERLRESLAAAGWPVAGLSFDPEMVSRGLIIDTEQGNLVKANRYGFIKHAMHGTRGLEFERQRELYARTIVDLHEPRWVFLHTLFSLSEGCMYAQLVDLLDRKQGPQILGYKDLWALVRRTLDAAHMEGRLKSEILADPERFIELDGKTALTLLDQHHAGKKLLLVTNSEWSYTRAMMTYCFDRFLPRGMTWRNLFDCVVVSARKPQFFTADNPFFEVVNEDGLLKPFSGRLQPGTAYLGGSARGLETWLGLSGDEILYVGDHMFADVHVSKNVLRWRTALIVQELDEEIRAVGAFHADEERLAALMDEKERLESESCRLRIEAQRKRAGYGPQPAEGEAALLERAAEIRSKLETLDQSIAPLARTATSLSNPEWGLLMRAGNDKSYLADQVERYADIYTSRVANLLDVTPFAFVRSHRGSLPHDPSLPGGRPLSSQSPG